MAIHMALERLVCIVDVGVRPNVPHSNGRRHRHLRERQIEGRVRLARIEDKDCNAAIRLRLHPELHGMNSRARVIDVVAALERLQRRAIDARLARRRPCHHTRARMPCPVLVDRDRLAVGNDRPKAVQLGRVERVEPKHQWCRHDDPRGIVRSLPFSGSLVDSSIPELNHVGVRPTAAASERCVPRQEAHRRLQIAQPRVLARINVARRAEEVHRAVNSAVCSSGWAGVAPIVGAHAPMAVLDHHATAGCVDARGPQRNVHVAAASIQFDAIEAIPHERLHVLSYDCGLVEMTVVLGAEAVVHVPAHSHSVRVAVVGHLFEIREAIPIDHWISGSIMVGCIALMARALLPIVIETDVDIAEQTQ